MAIRQILKYPDPFLELPTYYVDFSDIRHDSSLFDLQISDMIETLASEARGAALAANQVGLHIKAFVINPKLAAANNLSEVIVNPTITRIGNTLSKETEGCLSFPRELKIEVTRPKKIEVEFESQFGIRKTAKLSGFIARVFLHEIDHLDGTLFIDKESAG